MAEQVAKIVEIKVDTTMASGRPPYSLPSNIFDQPYTSFGSDVIFRLRLSGWFSEKALIFIRSHNKKSDRIAACLIDGVIVVIPVQEDVEAEREGKDEQGIPTAKRRGSIHRQTSTTCG